MAWSGKIEDVAVDGGTMMVDGIMEMQFRILGVPV